jgi:tetratricopeptide (TPR) repeat protein
MVIMTILLIVAALIFFQQSDLPRYFDELDQQENIRLHSFLNLSDTIKYVGMAECRVCHEAHYRNFIETGMGQSFGDATREKSAGYFHNNHPVYDPHLDFYYFPFWDGDTMKIMEFRLSGKDTVFKRIEKIDYIVGSGHHTNSHLMNVNGYLYQVPVTYYTQEKKWDLPPGFEDGNNTRFSRIIGEECMSCHNGNARFDYSSMNKFNHVPKGIDCERCHGPGELHVKTRQRGELIDTRRDTDFTIINPAKLPLAYQVDVCQRCHLQGNTVLKEGKNFYDFRPGMRLNEIMDVFLPRYENEEQHFIMASHSERLQMSPCYTQSHARAELNALTCFTCHNPHITVRVSKKQMFINACLDCHRKVSNRKPEDPCTENLQKRIRVNNNDCIACHMPPSTTIDIPHVTITDHFIRKKAAEDKRTPGDPKLLGLRSITTEKPDAVTMAKAYLFYFEKFEAQPFLLDSAYSFLTRLNEKEHLPLWVYYYYLRRNDRQLISIAERHQFRNITTAVSNYQVGQAYQNLGNLTSATKFFSEAVRLMPHNLDYRIKTGTIYLMQDNLPAAQQELEFVLKENPKLIEARNNYGYLLLRQNKIAEAEKNINMALQLNPDYSFARLNKARVHIYRNEIEKAREQILYVLRREPENQEARQLMELLR